MVASAHVPAKVAAGVERRDSTQSYAIVPGITRTMVVVTANLVARPLEPAHAPLFAERKPAGIACRVCDLPSQRRIYERRPALKIAVVVVPAENTRGAESGRVVVRAAQVELSYQRANIAGVGEDLGRRDFIRRHLGRRQ